MKNQYLIKEILLVFFHGIGDAVRFMPALRMFNSEYRDVKVNIMCPKNVEELFRVNPYVKKVFVSSEKNPKYGIWPLFWLSRHSIMKEANKIAKENHIKKVIFLVPHGINSYLPIPGILFRTFPFLYSLDKNEIIKFCNILRVGKKNNWPEEFKPEVFYDKKEYEKGKDFVRKLGKRVAVVHLNATSSKRVFNPTERAELLEYLIENNYNIILLNENIMTKKIVSVNPKTISFTIGLIDNANLFVGPDSGPANIATALKTKSIIVSKVIPPYLGFIPRANQMVFYGYNFEKIKKMIDKFS